MKNIFRFIFLVFCLLTTLKPLQAQWVNTNVITTSANALVVSGTNLFAGTNGGTPTSGVFLSTNNGTSWARVATGLSNSNIYALAFSSSNLFAGAYDGVYLTTNTGKSWTSINSGLTNTYIFSVCSSERYLFAGTVGGGVYRSADNGSNWTAASSGLTSTIVYAFAVAGTNLFAGTNNGVFLSTNNGTSWTAVSAGLTNTMVYAFAVSSTKLFAATNDGVFVSTNNGTNWASTTIAGQNHIVSLALYGTNLFAGSLGNGVFLLTNNSTNWIAVNTGFPVNPVTGLISARVHALAVSGSNLIAGIEEGVPAMNDGIWRRPLTEIVTSTGNASNEVPTHFRLDQNYPNPFNPSTTISFSIPTKSFTSLKVFDVLGKQVSTLVSEELSAGRHFRTWNASTMPSSVYFYRLQSESFTETRKLVVLR